VRVTTHGQTDRHTDSQTQTDFIICPMLYAIAMGEIIKRSLYLRQRWTNCEEILQEHADCDCKACSRWKFAYFKKL